MKDVIDPSDCVQPCPDLDEDGHGMEPCGDDCDDTDRNIHPMAFEVCNDGKDNDCAYGADGRDPSCRNCTVESEQDCRDARGVWDPEFCWCYWSPVLIDVRGNGFALTGPDAGVSFDLNADGVKEKQSWTAPGSDDAWLALDRDGNGGNSDGVIDARDSVFASLRLWQDANHDGASEPGELHAPGALHVASISLGYREVRRRDRYGNWFRYQAEVTGTDNRITRRLAYDVYLVPAR